MVKMPGLRERLDGQFRTRYTEDDEGDGSWPPPPSITVHSVKGNLAERVRRRFGADSKATVTLTEETWYGGYECTQENSTEFVIECAGHRVEFHPDRSEIQWHDELSRPESIQDSVFARFDAWLSAAERPDELFAEWFDDTVETCDWWVKYDARPDTMLWRAAHQHAHYKLGSVQLFKHPVGGYADRSLKLGSGVESEWILRFIETADGRGFRAVRSQTYLRGLPPEPTNRQFLESVTDLLLVGNRSA